MAANPILRCPHSNHSGQHLADPCQAEEMEATAHAFLLHFRLHRSRAERVVQHYGIIGIGRMAIFDFDSTSRKTRSWHTLIMDDVRVGIENSKKHYK